jgi:zinc protease
VELREKRALTYDFEALHVSGLDYGCFSINCAVKTESIEQTGIIIKDELEKLKTKFVTKDELEKSKNLILGEILRSMDSPQELSSVMADMEIHFQNENALIDYKDKMSAVSEREILEVANKYFQEKNYSTAVLKPKK